MYILAIQRDAKNPWQSPIENHATAAQTYIACIWEYPTPTPPHLSPPQKKTTVFEAFVLISFWKELLVTVTGTLLLFIPWIHLTYQPIQVLAREASVKITNSSF